ncbi:hypothetical protein B484DRAFT_450684 [Ochromonadaceae sp. CCMP2298]|nr:hypothetical protein B484DRAFT_450684 [Ochromonadaceae sp. CCMP2298]
MVREDREDREDRVARLTCHLSLVTCHLSLVNCHLSEGARYLRCLNPNDHIPHS